MLSAAAQAGGSNCVQHCCCPLADVTCKSSVLRPSPTHRDAAALPPR